MNNNNIKLIDIDKLYIGFNEKMIAVSCITMTTGTAIFNIDFVLRFITNCYDIITIYHQSSSISISCTGQGGAVL